MSEDATDISDYKERFRHLLELRIERDIDEVKAKKSKAAYREAEIELFTMLEEAGIMGRQTFDFGPELGKASFQRRSTKFGSVVDLDVAIKALEAEGAGDAIFKRAIQEKRLNELVRDRLEAGQPLPDGIDYYKREGITLSRK